jgi:WD40 repeat protein
MGIGGYGTKYPYRKTAIGSVPSGTQLVAADLTGAIYYWNSRSSMPTKTLRAKGPLIKAVAISPDGSRVVALEGDEMGMVPPGRPGLNLPIVSGKASSKFPASTDQPTSAVFSPDGTRLIIGYRSGQILVWPASHLEAGLSTWRLYQ